MCISILLLLMSQQETAMHVFILYIYTVILTPKIGENRFNYILWLQSWCMHAWVNNEFSPSPQLTFLVAHSYNGAVDMFLQMIEEYYKLILHQCHQGW